MDHRRLKTPNGKPLLVESEPLARAIAAEWDAQTDSIAQGTMHLVSLYVLAMLRSRNTWIKICYSRTCIM